jgi:eukaryotic-like serine/threonine-protein kinase
LLTKVKNFWVKGVLEKSLHQQVLISLGLEERPDAIASPWNLILGTEDRSPQELPPGTSVISEFDKIGAGRTLLILGEPGSGKTISLLQLARDLIDRAEQNPDHLIPVVFNLSSWTAQRQPLTLADWLIAELNSKYQVPKRLAKDWVEQQQLRLLLDGLDEVRAEHRDACVAAINTFQQEHSTEIVVCSRSKDYDRLTNRLNFQNAIYLKPLTQPQIHQYLEECSSLPRDGRGVAFGKSSLGSPERYRPNATPLRETPATFQTSFDLTGLRSLLNQDTALQELAHSPLMLNIMVLAYQGVAVEDLPRVSTVEARQEQLFDDYIDRMFEKSRKFSYVGQDSEAKQLYQRHQATLWLIWLAQQMVRESQTVYLIEQTQPACLKSDELKHYKGWVEAISLLILSPLIILFSCYFGWILSEVFFKGILQILSSVLNIYLPSFIGVAVLWASVSIMFLSFRSAPNIILRRRWTSERLKKIQPVEELRWSWRDAKEGAISGFTAAYTGRAAPFVALIGAVIGGWIPQFQLYRTVLPNQGIWQSTKACIKITLTAGFAVGLPIAIVEVLLGNIMAALTSTFVFGMFAMPVVVLINDAGLTCVQHLALRLTLYCNRCISWNYARFLDWATDRLLLQKVGGGYIFVHRLLMEHFAQMEIGES